MQRSKENGLPEEHWKVLYTLVWEYYRNFTNEFSSTTTNIQPLCIQTTEGAWPNRVKSKLIAPQVQDSIKTYTSRTATGSYRSTPNRNNSIHSWGRTPYGHRHEFFTEPATPYSIVVPYNECTGGRSQPCDPVCIWFPVPLKDRQRNHWLN